MIDYHCRNNSRIGVEKVFELLDMTSIKGMITLRCYKTAISLPAINKYVSSKYSTLLLPEDKVTHTGQKWENNDYRLSRFVNNPKHVNTNVAMELIAELLPKKVKSRVVACDGGGGPTGHPQVFINLDKPGNHSCGYCGLRFELDHLH